jgi:hypothetical protein
MSANWYRNERISKDNARVFKPANRYIYCADGQPPFTREHVIPRGMGGGRFFRKRHAKSAVRQSAMWKLTACAVHSYRTDWSWDW